jgi:hypothetical protein
MIMARKKMLYVVATVTREEGGWRGAVQLPTFALDPDIQGIRNAKHAGDIVRKIVDPLGIGYDIHVVVSDEDGWPEAAR